MDKFKKIIIGCINNNKIYQKMLYDKFSPKLYAIIIRYLCGDETYSNDILQYSFIKIFKNIKTINKYDENSIFGWMKKICIDSSIINISLNPEINNNNNNNNGILNILNELPYENRILFNLYAIDGYSHDEISEMLNIDIEYSKCQYDIAKNILMQKINTL